MTAMHKNAIASIQASLLALGDGDYAAFQCKLMPTVDPACVIGVRTPLLRRYAKQLAKTAEAELFLQTLPHTYYEENNLHAALLEQKKDFDTAITEVERFLPYVDNWATCDSFCPGVLKKEPQRLWEAILRWLSSDKVYTVRYGLVRLLNWYLDAPNFSPAVLEVAANVTHDDYYVRMAVAWLFSMALVKQYDATLPYLTACRLPVWIHNKAIQKAVESYRIDPATKTYLKTLKRKERHA